MRPLISRMAGSNPGEGMDFSYLVFVASCRWGPLRLADYSFRVRPSECLREIYRPQYEAA